MAESGLNKEMKVIITTQSNVLMGGAESSFEIGGVDQSTVVNIKGKPYIPASAFKGMLRKIMYDYNGTEEGNEINKIFTKFLEVTKKDLLASLDSYLNNNTCDDVKIKKINDLKENVEKIYSDQIEKVTPASILGIQNIQQTPKVIFTDFEFKKGEGNIFSIDNKNSIDEEGLNIKSNPRTYRTIGKNVVFEGQIYFYNFDKFGEDASKIVGYVKEMLLKFNDGIYRIGNSKSRGYGKIKVEIVD